MYRKIAVEYLGIAFTLFGIIYSFMITLGIIGEYINIFE